MKIKLFLLIAMLICTSAARAQKSEKPEGLNPISPDTIPFVLTDHNNISIQTILNGKDTLNLMFHTAVNAVSLTRKATEKLPDLAFDDPETVESWGGQSSSRTSRGNALQIGRQQFTDLTIWENEHSGPNTDGKFGPNLFAPHVIEINYDLKIIILHPALPQLDEHYVKVRIEVENDAMFIEGNSIIAGEAYKNRFLIHSGYAGTLLFDDEFSNQHKMGEKLEIISESELKDSAGNRIKTQKASMPAFRLGGVEFNDIPVGFFAGTIGRQRMSVLGGDLLKRFNSVFDLDNQQLYLKPNQLSNLPFSTS